MTRRPLTATNLALTNLGRRPYRTVALSATVALFACVVFGGSLLSEGVRLGMDSMAQRLGSDILLVPRGYEKKAQAVLLRGEPSTFHLRGDLPEKIRSVPGVDKVSAQLYLATLNAACCTLPVQLIAYDPQSDFVVQPWLDRSLAVRPRNDEVVVGDKIVGIPGNRISLFGREFVIAARLDRTGMGFDTSVFMTIPRARQMLRESEAAAELEKALGPNPVSSVMVSVAPEYEIKDVANDILRRFAAAYDLDIMVTKNLVKDIAERLKNLSTLLLVLTGALWLAALLVLTLFFSAMMNERRREFGLFRVLGATRRWLSGLVLTEALAIGVLGATAGLVLAALALFPFHNLIGASLGLPYLAVPVATVAWFAAAAFFLAVLVGPAACAWTAYRIGVSDAYTTLREEN